jgi:hypothetical protein
VGVGGGGAVGGGRGSVTGASPFNSSASTSNIHELTELKSNSNASAALTHRRQEGLYVKFLRLGGIQIDVSTTGFIINLTKFKAQMDEFRCQGEVLQWSTLIFNMERHLAMSLFRNAASSSLSRVARLFRFSSSSSNLSTSSAGSSTHGSSSADLSHLKKAAHVKWEDVEDPSLANALKRSALGLPPTSINDKATRAKDKESTQEGKGVKVK